MNEKELVSNCCECVVVENTDLCGRCLEHCEEIEIDDELETVQLEGKSIVTLDHRVYFEEQKKYNELLCEFGALKKENDYLRTKLAQVIDLDKIDEELALTAEKIKNIKL